MCTSLSNKQKGFTLIEMLVALSLFTIVVTVSVGAFLSLIGASKGVQSQQSVMTTLTFVLDSMTREIRTGTNYVCDSRDDLRTGTIATTSIQDCVAGDEGISFVEAGSSITSGSSNKRIAYYYDTNTTATNTIMRRVGNDTPQSIVADGITVTGAQFFVTGTDRLSFGSDTTQPTVTIVLEARDDTGATTTLQTTVTQRELDI